jgi:amino acid transporter
MGVDPSAKTRLKHLLIGRPRDLADKTVFHHLSLIPFLAWVGLGADGLSSSAYGPEEAFRTLGAHTYLAVALAVVMILTVLIISAAYSRIIEDFPHGGGGYVVASKLLGRKIGVVSGSALLVDYVLTITTSIAAAGDALFSVLPLQWHALKLPLEIALVLGLTTLNIRGVRESVLVLAPIFVVFLVTHAVAIGWGIAAHAPELPATTAAVATGFRNGWTSLGPVAMLLLFVHAYSLGGGTYTGIEAVSNGLPIMREPRVATAKRTMVYMAASLAATASGLLICYLLWKVTAVEGKTMNAVFLEKLTGSLPFGGVFVVVSLIAEGLLLVVAAQAGFIDGPRVLANMAVDSWVPRRFAALSDRLTTGNGIVLMGGASLLALWYTKGDVAHLVVMYSINVFLTFSLSIFGMLRFYWRQKRSAPRWARSIVLFAVGFLMCATILAITVVEKFQQGGWVTLAVTGGLVFLCFRIKAHYLTVARKLARLQKELDRPPPVAAGAERTAAILVGGYGGLGIHTVQTILTTFPGVYRNFVFVSVGVVDSGAFKGEGAIEKLRIETEAMLQKYVAAAAGLGMAATWRSGIGTDVVEEAAALCEGIAKDFPQTTFFTGKIIFTQERWYQRLLHNETGLSLQKRLQLAGHTMVVLPAKVA